MLRCRSRHIFGGAKHNCLNFPKLVWKVFGQFFVWVSPSTQIIFGMTPKKRFLCDSPHVGRQFFKIKQRWAPFLSVFSSSLARISGILQTCSYIFPRFSRILPRFSGILPRFLTNQYFGGALAPPATPPPTPLGDNKCFLNYYRSLNECINT